MDEQYILDRSGEAALWTLAEVLKDLTEKFSFNHLEINYIHNKDAKEGDPEGFFAIWGENKEGGLKNIYPRKMSDVFGFAEKVRQAKKRED